MLKNDWFATQTFQYHEAFGWLTRVLMRAGVLEPAFLIGYAALLLLFHVAWWRLVHALWGGAGTFIVAEVLYHVSAGGTGLGMYQVLQDASFLPSNIAAVAMLWGLVLWIDRRPIPAGACFGIAGIFHLDFALAGIGVWGLLILLQWWRSGTTRTPLAVIATATLLAVAPCLINIGLALWAMAHLGPRMPLSQFVDLYVRLRHPHHYDPSSWPAWLWLSFLWPMPLAGLEWWRRRRGEHGRITERWVRARDIFFIFMGLILIALLGAGITYVSEPLIQASLYRFSVYPKLLSCTGAGFFLYGVGATLGRPKLAPIAAMALGALTLLICIRRGPYLGLFYVPEDEVEYLQACDWIREHTPTDAVFLVPPQEQEFRLRAQRAIVVNYKGVPQLSSELGEWRDRLADVLDLSDLRALPRPFAKTLRAIRDRYASLPPQHLEWAARRYGARYIVTNHRFPSGWERRRVQIDGNHGWFMYDLSR